MGKQKEKLPLAQVRQKLRNVVSKTPIELFDAKPYVDYQRQKYLANVSHSDKCTDNLIISHILCE